MRRILAFTPILVCFLSLSAWAQDTAKIVGSVIDSSAAVIVGAKVTVSNPDKGFTRELVSNSAGEYSVGAVPIGNYVVTAEAPGFQKLVRTGITLTVGQIQRVDMQLQVGQTTQEITVTGNLPQVQTETATVSALITNQQIANLDLNGRNWVTLALMVPGAAPDNGLDAIHVGVAGNNSVSFNGNRMQYANWEIDGGANTDEGSASTFNTYPNLDTIAEFRISTSTYGADMGKHAGANIELATKGGTRNFHGDAFEYVRNDVFDANDFFTNRGCLADCQAQNGGHAPKNALKWNDFGYTLGGPVYIPGHYNTDKSKTFFYWSQDWRRYRQGQVVGPADVPSVRERSGDFSECDPTSGNYNAVVAAGCNLPTLSGVAYDTVQSMPGFDAQAFTNGTDLLNALVPSPNSGPVQWTLASSAPTNWRQEQIRIDQNISDKTQAFFRYTQDTWNTLSVPSLWTGANFDTIKTQFGGPGESAVFHVTHTFKPTLVNEFVASYTTDHIILIPVAGGSSKGINRPSDFVMSHLFSQNDNNPLYPDLTIGGGTAGFYEAFGNTPWYNSNPIITWKDNLSWIHGSHTIKMGFYLENYRKSEQFGTVTQGDLHFEGGGSITTTNGLADMFLGRIQRYTEGAQAVNGVAVGGYPKGHWQMTDLEPYIQDDWKVNPHLTVNLGVRYYIYSRIHDVSRPTIDSGFLPNQYDPALEAQLDADGHLIPGSGHVWTSPGNGLVMCGQGGIPKGCQLANTAGNIAPRFGFAWDPLGKGTTSIRGGYGIYYESGNGNEAQAEGGEGNPPSDLSPSAFNALGYSAIEANGPLGPGNYTTWPYSQAWPSVQQFSLTVEHQFSNSDLVSVAYVGGLGRHLARAQLINQINPALVQNGGTLNAPALANLTGTKAADPALNAPGDVGQQLCDASGTCDVATTLIFNEQPSIFFAPFRGYNTITSKQNTAVSSYNALQASIRHTSHGLTLQASYTWSHSIDDSSQTYSVTSGGINDYNLSRWKGTSELNRAQILQMNYVYALPFFKNSTSAVARQALGGWQVSGIASLFTGQPSDFNCGVTGYSTNIGGSYRCDVVGKVAPTKGIYNDPVYGPTVQWWNPATVAQPSFSELSTTYGNMGRDVLTGPGRNNWDMALMKNFRLHGEQTMLQFRLETFNTFNHPQWKGIENGCKGKTGFGQTCELNTNTPGEVNSDWGPRNVQLGLKLIF
ncbi:MAG: carboxypeptidase-like regulatory domain-containing protein [Terriglobia bacterium]